MSNGRHRARVKRHPLRVSLLVPAAMGAASFGFLLVPDTAAAPAATQHVHLSASSHRIPVTSRGTARKALVTLPATPKAKTVSAAPAGLNFAPCGSASVEYGLQPGAVRLYRAVCNAFPGQISHFGGLGAGEHANGKAIDFMVYGNAALGQQVANFLRSHAYELGLYDIIWQQRIWTPTRASEGWRWMANRGSITANHYDHVHSSVN
jgi:hypothetical protein